MHQTPDLFTGPPIPDGVRRFSLDETLERVAHWLPTQGPIKDFIHHNTLHALQHLPFHEGVGKAARIFGARSYLPLEEYRQAFRQGRIAESSVQAVLERRHSDRLDQALWRDRLTDERLMDEPVAPGLAAGGVRARWKARGLDLDAAVHPLLFRLLSQFLDQGISLWRMPHAPDRFWNAVGRLVAESAVPLVPLSDRECRELLTPASPEQAVICCLSRLVGPETHWEVYILEMLLAHPGWSGMVHMVEREPASLLTRRLISLRELVAVELLLELGTMRRRRGDSFAPLAEPGEAPPAPPETLAPVDTPAAELKRLWQEAMEWTLYCDLLTALETPGRRAPAGGLPLAQAFFCIDDRETGLRRHLEEVNPRIETLSTAGFFGLDFLFQGLRDAYPVQQCPVVIRPRHLVREVRLKAPPVERPTWSRRLHFRPSSHTLFRGWLITQFVGPWTALRLAVNVLKPGFRLFTERTLSRVEGPTRYHLLRESDETTEEGYWLGYTIEEMVDRVYGVFESVGLRDRFAPLLVFIAHGSSSANNPHFAAYDCGACSGKPGAPNARAFAWIANHPEVRRGLAARGLVIPGGTVVVGGTHDTARDEVTFFDREDLPPTHRPLLEAVERSLGEALARNAKERCRRFELVEPDLTPREALRRVRERADSIFEPRPELNHATNAFCIVGRRELTRGLFLDRRAFLNSYDPATDPDGRILAGILGAVIPVCAGITLEYYFSRVDPMVYGAGTKLPHNVVGLVGVSNGVEGDLRTGLPTQMTEIHDPVRLLVVVEQEPEIALKAGRLRSATWQWVENRWVHYACLSPRDGRTYLWDGTSFNRVLPGAPRMAVPTAPDSLTLVAGRADNIPVHRIGGRS